MTEPVLNAVRHDGYGSTGQDIMDACKKLNLVGLAFDANRRGLQDLPKPLIAHVEHDHFITIIDADRSGLTYLCSDCGTWPGGKVKLSWKQWEAMEADLFFTVQRKGSPLAIAFEKVRKLGSQAKRAALEASNTRSVASSQASQLASILAVNVTLQYLGPQVAIVTTCGNHRSLAYKAPPGADTPTDSPGGHGPGCATCGDPVNLATGEEQYAPPPDLVVYNPIGPSVVWQRNYGSMRGQAPGETNSAPAAENYAYNSTDFGMPWSNSYNLAVFDPNCGTYPQLIKTYALSVYADSSDAVTTSGATWDVVRAGTVQASSVTPNSWSMTIGSGFVSVIAPTGSASGQGYELRWLDGPTHYSARADVLSIGQAPQDSTGRISMTGHTAPTGSWDVLLSGTTVASSASPNGWETPSFSPSDTTLTIRPPRTAAISSAYTVRITYSGTNYSGSLIVIASRSNAVTGTKYLLMPDGATIGFTAATKPNSVTTTVNCTAAAGSPLFVQWLYNANDTAGNYLVTFADGSKWFTSPCNHQASMAAWQNQVPIQISDRVGNYINLNYAYYPSAGGTVHSNSGSPWMPVLTSITDSSLNVLLSFTRDSTFGTVSAVSDCYGRSVYYNYSYYNDQNVLVDFVSTPSHGGETLNLRQVLNVSQVVTTGASTHPDRYTYTYTNPFGLDNAFQVLTTIVAPSPTGSGNATATINYLGSGVITSIVDGDGNSHTYTPGTGGKTTVTTKDSVGTTVVSRTVSFDGSMRQTNLYDGANNLVWTKAYTSLTSPNKPSTFAGDSHTAEIYIWDSYGNLTRSTNSQGIVTNYVWDTTNFAPGLLISVQEGSKTATTIAYDAYGRISTVTAPVPGTTGGSTQTSTYAYDDTVRTPATLHQLTSITTPGNGTVTSHVATFNYLTDGTYSQSEMMGRPITVSDTLSHKTHLRYDTQGNVLTSTDPVGNQVSYTYNIANQDLTATYPATGQTGTGHSYTSLSYLYPGGPLQTESLYDERGTLSRQTTKSLGQEGELLSESTGSQSVTNTYDAAYRIKTVTDALSHTTTYHYNTAGYLSQVDNPGGDNTQYTYDTGGFPATRVDGNGVTTTYTFDSTKACLNSVTYPTAIAAYNVTFTHDLSTGRVSQVADSTGSESYQYDDNDALTQVSTTYGSLSAKTVSYTYNPDGSRATMVSPAGTFTYSYDGAGRMTSLVNPFSETTSYGYDDDDRMSSHTLHVGFNSYYTYNALSQLIDLTSKYASSVTIWQFTSINHDAAGNRSSESVVVNGGGYYAGTMSFGHDSNDQVTSASGTQMSSMSKSFGYDAAGNMTNVRGTTFGYNSNNQITNTGYSYDSNGNPTTYAGSTATYDPENHLISYGSGYTAGYRSDGLRAWRTISGTKTYFLYDLQTGHLISELDSTGALTATDTFGADGLASRRLGSTTLYYVFDEAGNTVSRHNSTGTSVYSAGYDPFGLYHTVGTADQYSNFGGQWGGYYEPSIGLILFGQRYYDPATCRFINRDPTGFAGGMNLYGYAGNNPTDFADPSGLLHIVITIYDDGYGLARIYANAGDVIGLNPRNDKPIRARGGELLAQYHASNRVPHPDADPNRDGSGGPFPDGDYTIDYIGHGRGMGPNWFHLKGGFAALRGTWWHSGAGIHWKKGTLGCARSTEHDLNDATTWYTLQQYYNHNKHTLTMQHIHQP